MDLYSFDILNDNKLPEGEGFYNPSNIIIHGGDISLMCNDVKERDYQRYVTHDVRRYILDIGYIMYQIRDTKDLHIKKLRVGIDMDFETGKGILYDNTHIIRLRYLKNITQYIIREYKIDKLFT